LMRSLSCAFIWHPKVVTWYVLCHTWRSSSGGAMSPKTIAAPPRVSDAGGRGGESFHEAPALDRPCATGVGSRPAVVHCTRGENVTRMKLTLAVALCAAVTGAGASAAFAGEVTGSGANSNQNQGRSWCSFSGLNDQTNGQTLTKAQSWGQDLKTGIIEGPPPGIACNPNRTPLPPNPNRTH
jgi:hypothetical protein